MIIFVNRKTENIEEIVKFAENAYGFMLFDYEEELNVELSEAYRKMRELSSKKSILTNLTYYDWTASENDPRRVTNALEILDELDENLAMYILEECVGNLIGPDQFDHLKVQQHLWDLHGSGLSIEKMRNLLKIIIQYNKGMGFVRAFEKELSANPNGYYIALIDDEFSNFKDYMKWYLNICKNINVTPLTAKVIESTELNDYVDNIKLKIKELK